MAAVHGKTGGVLFDEYDISSYLTQAAMVKATQTVDITTMGSDDRTYIAGQGSGSVSFNGVWDGGAAAADAILDAAVGADAVVTVGIGGTATLGGYAILLQALEAGYQIRSTVNDAVRITVNATANTGIRVAGRIVQEVETVTGTFNGTSVDDTAGSSLGGVGHLHVFSIGDPGSGLSGTFKIQDSPNNSDWADLVTFSAVTAAGAQRIEVAGTVDRYLRFICSADSFDQAVVAAAFARNRR